MVPVIDTILLTCSLITGVAAVVSLIISIGTRIKAKSDKGKGMETATRSMILGLGYAKITAMCEDHIDRGYMTKSDYSDLRKYLYDPYKAMGGNGTVDRLMAAIEDLPIRPKEGDE